MKGTQTEEKLRKSFMSETRRTMSRAFDRLRGASGGRLGCNALHSGETNRIWYSQDAVVVGRREQVEHANFRVSFLHTRARHAPAAEAPRDSSIAPPRTRTTTSHRCVPPAALLFDVSPCESVLVLCVSLNGWIWTGNALDGVEELWIDLDLVPQALNSPCPPPRPSRRSAKRRYV